MSIVVITIPGEAKRTFVNALYRKTNGDVRLVIVQKQPKRSFLKRLKHLYRAVGFWNMPRELWYALLLRIDGEAEKVLGYFRERTGSTDEKDFLPQIFETHSVNSDEVFGILKEISPDLIAVWGSTIIKPHILNTAKRAINLHMGVCPYYRGAIANQRAVMSRQLARIGATIHYVDEKVDSGNILETIIADASKSPKELFQELNDRAEARYLELASTIYTDKTLPSIEQNISQSDNFLLKHWTPQVRYHLAKQMMRWEDTGTL